MMTIYEKNMAQLHLKFPEVDQWLSKEEEDDPIEIIQAKNGRENLGVKGSQGRSTYIYDLEDPLREEKELCRRLDFSEDRVTFVIGVGLGYILSAVRGKMKKGHKIVILERKRGILGLALSRIDASDLIAEGPMGFSLPDDESMKITIIHQASNLLPNDVIIIANKRLMMFSRKCFEINQLVNENLGCTMIPLLTALNHARKCVHNEIENLPKFLFSAGIRNLFGRFKEIPGIIISAGPSLPKNIHHLNRLTNLQAALGLAQLEQLPVLLKKKRALAECYQKALAEVPGIRYIAAKAWAESNCWLNTVLLPDQGPGPDHKSLVQKLAKEGIEARPIFFPIHMQKSLKNYWNKKLPVSERCIGLNLPSSFTLSEEDVIFVVKALWHISHD